MIICRVRMNLEMIKILPDYFLSRKKIESVDPESGRAIGNKDMPGFIGHTHGKAAASLVIAFNKRYHGTGYIDHLDTSIDIIGNEGIIAENIQCVGCITKRKVSQFEGI